MVNQMNHPKKLRRIETIRNHLKDIATEIGPLHPNCDLIFDINALLGGNPTVLRMDIDRWIVYLEAIMRDTPDLPHSKGE